MIDIKEILKKTYAARHEVGNICERKREWTMCVPVRPDDSDVVICEGLDQVDVLVNHLQSCMVEPVIEQIQFADDNWPKYNSAHEAMGVLLEEVDELWDHVKVKQKRRDIGAMRKECLQIAAVAIRFARDVCNEEVGRK